MSSCLPINVDDLLRHRGIESSRVEFKASWELDRNDEPVQGEQVLRTVCAFANDLQNLNGGYIVIGVAEREGVAVLPPAGMPGATIDLAQRWIAGKCKERLDPRYSPVFSVEQVDGRHILVVWVPASDHRPHRYAGRHQEARAYVRVGSSTIEAKGADLAALIDQTAKVPFDDRRNTAATPDRIRATLVREFLADVRSDLVREPDDREVYRCMRLVAPVNAHDVPRNVALMFFADDPEVWFPGARIEVVQFRDSGGGDSIQERRFRGPIHRQLRDCLTYLQNASLEEVRKHPHVPETSGWVSFPFSALEEAVVNAVYHRSYEGVPEPTKVYLYPDRMEVTSYPGPVHGLELQHFAPNASRPPVPARNRRIGELLKELRMAEQRATGIAKIYRSMRDNGSPLPRFDFDAQRSYFRVILPAHPEFTALTALGDAARLTALGDEVGARERLQTAFAEVPASVGLSVQLIEAFGKRGEVNAAREVLDRHLAARRQTESPRAVAAMAAVYLAAGSRDQARALLSAHPGSGNGADAIELAIQERRAGREDRAHALFERAEEAVVRDPRALLEFAQSKRRLATKATSRPAERQASTRLLREAKALLERVLQMDASTLRHAWAWFELGMVRHHLQEPPSAVRAAMEKAVALAPGEQRFQDALARFGG